MTTTELLDQVADMIRAGRSAADVVAVVELYGDARADEVLAEVAR